MQTFRLGEHPIAQGDIGRQQQVAVRDRKRFRIIDGGVVRKLDSFDQVECDSVFEPAREESVPARVRCRRVTCMSWKRMLAKSSALVSSERSIAVSMSSSRPINTLFFG